MSECKTVKRYRKNGTAVMVDKYKHNTILFAEREARRINNMPKNYIKRVAYQCSKCGFYHVGTTLEMIANKKAPVKHLGVKVMRIAGFVDLTNITTKRTKISRKEYIKRLPVLKSFGEYQHRDGIVKYWEKEKVIKIQLPDGSIKMPKIYAAFKQAKEKKRAINYIKELVVNKYLPINKLKKITHKI